MPQRRDNAGAVCDSGMACCFKIINFCRTEATAPKNGVEFRQGSIGAIRSSLAASYDVWQRRQFSTNQRPRNYLRYTDRQTENQHTVRPCSTSSACKKLRSTVLSLVKKWGRIFARSHTTRRILPFLFFLCAKKGIPTLRLTSMLVTRSDLRLPKQSVCTLPHTTM